MTSLKRHYFMSKYVYCKVVQEIDKETYGKKQGRLFIISMIQEHTAILILPAYILINQKNAINIAMGIYDVTGNVNTNVLIFTTFFGLGVQVVIDMFCWYYLKLQFFLRETWEDMTTGSQWKKLAFALVFTASVGVAFMNFAFLSNIVPAGSVNACK
jgi:hypothetical protein